MILFSVTLETPYYMRLVSLVTITLFAIILKYYNLLVAATVIRLLVRPHYIEHQ